jgi:uncharacterized protein (TIGR03382 family)
VIDGSDEALEHPIWIEGGDRVYSTPFSGATLYVALDDERLYDYGSLADLRSEAAGLSGGFFVDGSAGRLYVKTPDGRHPSASTLHVAVRDQGFLLDTITDVVVEGFEIRYMGATGDGVAVDVRDSARCWIRGNSAHHMNTGFRVRRSMASENVIEANSFRDASVYGWPWAAVKSRTPEASAISVTHGVGNVVRRNVLEGSFNGIYIGAFGDGSEDIARETDVYENIMSRHGDDGLEPEGAQVNVRVWQNVIRGVKNAISLAPIEVGPTWIVRNLVDGYQDHVLKLNNGSTGWILVYHNTSVPLPGSDSRDAQAMEPSLPFGPLVSRNNIYTANRYVIEYGLDAVNDGVDLDVDNLWTFDVEDAGRFVKWLDVTYGNLAELRASGTIEGSGLQVPPQYEDAPGGDFTLIAGHPLVDAGVEIAGVNTRFIVGDGPDVGAFERGGIGPPIPPGDDGGTDTGTGTDDDDDGTDDGGSSTDDGRNTGEDGGDEPGPGDSGDAAGDASDEGCGCTASTTASTPLVLVLVAVGRRRRPTWDVRAGGRYCR